MFIALVSYSMSHNYLCDVIVFKLIKMKIVWIPSHRVRLFCIVCSAFSTKLNGQKKTRYLTTWEMPKEKAMNIKIKINHYGQVQWKTKKTCCYFSTSRLLSGFFMFVFKQDTKIVRHSGSCDILMLFWRNMWMRFWNKNRIH